MTRSGSRRRTAAQIEDAGGMDCHFISKIVKRTVLVIVKKVAVSQRS